MASMASSSDVVVLPSMQNTGAAHGLFIRSSLAVFAQLVCLANASLTASFFLVSCVRSDDISDLLRKLFSCSAVVRSRQCYSSHD